MDPRSTSADTGSSAESLAAGLSDLAAMAPDLTPAQWGRIGGGAALALVGSGLLSLGTVIRLAAVLGGGAVVYQTLKSAAPAAGAEGAAPRTESTWGTRASWQDGAPTHDADSDGATMEGSDPDLSSRSRGT